MAYTIATTYKGFPVDAYHKITGYTVSEDAPVDGVKKYVAKVQINSYTSPTKEFDIEQTTQGVRGLDASELNLAGLYAKVQPANAIQA
jgi:hypothetical protein